MAVPRTLVDGLAFAEGPRWHDGALWLSDMHRHRVLRVEEDGEVDTVLQHDSPVSGLGWLRDGSLLTVAMDGYVLKDGEVLADVRHLAPHGVNDMITHPDGWSWVGQFGYDRHAGGRPAPAPSALLRVDPDGSVREAAPDLLVANGMCLTPDGGTLLVAESAGLRVTAFTIDGDDGSLHDRRTFAEVPPPDGMCLDAEGAVWIAGVTVGAFLRVAEGGEVLDRIEVEEGRRAIACVLGGADRRTLHLLTATTTGEAEPSLAAMAARVQTAQVDVPGAGWP
jgi:sugar lactone lactonase YvrE